MKAKKRQEKEKQMERERAREREGGDSWLVETGAAVCSCTGSG